MHQLWSDAAVIAFCTQPLSAALSFVGFYKHLDINFVFKIRIESTRNGHCYSVTVVSITNYYYY